MFVPALLISLNKALAAPLWASWPGAGACIGGGGGACTGGGGGGTAGPAPALATAPYEKVNYSIIITVHVYIKGIDSAKISFSKQQILCLPITRLYFEQTFLVNRRSYSAKREHNCKPILAQGHGSDLYLETVECLSSDIQFYLIAFPPPRPHFFCQSQDEFRTKESEFVHEFWTKHKWGSNLTGNWCKRQCESGLQPFYLQPNIVHLITEKANFQTFSSQSSHGCLIYRFRPA